MYTIQANPSGTRSIEVSNENLRTIEKYAACTARICLYSIHCFLVLKVIIVAKIEFKMRNGLKKKDIFYF